MGIIKWACGGSETGFLTEIFVRMPKLLQKPDFFAQGAIAWGSETGFLTQIFGKMPKLSQKPGFSDYQLIQIDIILEFHLLAHSLLLL